MDLFSRRSLHQAAPVLLAGLCTAALPLLAPAPAQAQLAPAPCSSATSVVPSCLIDFSGTTYLIKTVQGSFRNGFPSPSNGNDSPGFWWGSRDLARSAAALVGSALGFPNDQFVPLGFAGTNIPVGPWFAWGRESIPLLINCNPFTGCQNAGPSGNYAIQFATLRGPSSVPVRNCDGSTDPTFGGVCTTFTNRDDDVNGRLNLAGTEASGSFVYFPNVWAAASPFIATPPPPTPPPTPPTTPDPSPVPGGPSIGPRTSTVPGPLPVLGAAAAFGFSRRLRKRMGR